MAFPSGHNSCPTSIYMGTWGWALAHTLPTEPSPQMGCDLNEFLCVTPGYPWRWERVGLASLTKEREDTRQLLYPHYKRRNKAQCTPIQRGEAKICSLVNKIWIIANAPPISWWCLKDPDKTQLCTHMNKIGWEPRPSLITGWAALINKVIST